MKTMDFKSPSRYVVAILFGLTFAIVSCRESGPDQQEVRSNLCYHGTVVGSVCPSFLFVQVANAKIGSKWSNGKTQFDNVVSINNYSDSISFTGSKQIFFKVKSVAQNGQKCVRNDKPCQHVLYYES